ncbi:DUF748 domain-containing protein [Shewanella fidelis]|uniref:DUF748 domain-containing protein n=1 Tax=Shewanella fidelis TaxID=173509 RepID=UPI00048F5047|nr:DUF748 domain-containing protein [Shewanella fidelis]
MSFIKKLLQSILSGYRQRPRYQRLIIIFSVLYFSFTAILGLLVPYIAVKQVPQQLSTLLQRPVTLEDIKINPFTFDVTIDNFQVHEPNKQAFIGFRQLAFELQFWDSLFNTAYSVTNVTLTEPNVNIERIKAPQSLRFNFSDIIDTLAKRPSTDENEASQHQAAIPHFIISNLAIIKADLNFEDHVTDAQLHYPELNLNVKYFDSKHAIQSTLSQQTDGQSINPDLNRYSVHIVGRQGGEIATQGQVQLSPLSVIGDVQLTNIQLPQFWSFISEQFAPVLSSGRLTLSSNYQLQIQNDKLAFKADNGRLQLDDINFDYQSKSVINLPMITLQGINVDLQNQTITAQSLDTKGLVLNTTIDKNGVSLANIFTPIANGAANVPTAKAPASTAQTGIAQEQQTTTNHSDTTNSRSWSAVLKKVNLENYQVNLTEALVTKATLWQISDIALNTGAITDSLAEPIDYQLSFNINQQGHISSSGSITPLAQTANTELRVTNLALTQIQGYLTPYINIELKQGDVNTQGTLNLDAKTEQLSYQGNLAVNDLIIKDTVQKKELLKWKALDINSLKFDKQNNSLDIDQVSLTQPYGRIIIAKDKSTNIGDLIVQTAPEKTKQTNKQQPTKVVQAKVSTKADKSAAATQPIALSINQISFKDGSTFFADNSLTPNFAASIEHLDGKISKLSSDSKQTASVDIKGKIDRYAPVTLKGDINPLLAQPYLDLALSFKHVELTSVNPYSGTYAGYYIDKGLLSLDLNYQLDKNQLVGDNHLVVDQLKLGKPSDSSLATTLPVTLAIALLQDRHGVIDLGLQVSGDVDDPSFSIGSIVMTAFTNVITKAVTAPFSLLAGLLGDDADELDKIQFAAGDATISTQQQQTLDKLAKGLADRPMLTLSVEGGLNMQADSQALSEQQLRSKLAQTANIPLQQLPEALSPSNYPTTGPLAEALIDLYEVELGKSASVVKDSILAEHQQETPLTDEQLLTRWHIALYNFVLGAQRISEDALGKLAQARAAAVKTYLIEQQKVDPKRIFLLDSRVELNTEASQALLTLGAN